MIPRTMTVWFVVAIPVLIMFFALAMERLEHRLRYLAARENLTVHENEVGELLAAARRRRGATPSALELLQRRRGRRAAVVPSHGVEQRP